MSIRVNPGFISELEKYGAADVQKCYHCGNCSAACPFSKEPFIIPRKSMRYLQMGMEKRLQGTLEPWLCYYCGECSEQCPRGAEPGETMMSLRRWLTSRYDFTGLSKLFYHSWKAEVLALVLLALATGIGFFLWGSSMGDINHYDGPQAFLPSSAVHIFDWSMAGVLVLLLGINALRMWWFSLGSREDLKLSFFDYLKAVYLLPLHFFTQLRYSQCESKRPWLVHLVLMLSYVTLFVLIMFFLHEMQSGPQVDWRVHIFGYLAAAGLVLAVILAIRGRLKKDLQQYRHSHASDWLFLGLLLYVALTGVVQHVFHRTGYEFSANISYILHMMGVVPMLLLEVPFGKWSHLAYRPLAIYFAGVAESALLKQNQQQITEQAGAARAA